MIGGGTTDEVSILIIGMVVVCVALALAILIARLTLFTKDVEAELRRHRAVVEELSSDLAALQRGQQSARSQFVWERHHRCGDAGTID